MRDVIASSGGINWCWYHWLTIDDEARTVVETRADRFHRFDEEQGAGRHPTPTVKSFAVYHAPDSALLWDAWARNVAPWGLPEGTRAIAVIDGKAYVYVGK